jgi:hypothetical protein
MWNKLFFLLIVMSNLVGLSAQSIPDTIGLPPVVTKYIADLSAVVTALNLEKAAAITALEKLRTEYEILKSTSAEAAEKAIEDIDRLEDAVDLRGKRIAELQNSQAKGETNFKKNEQENRTLTNELKNLRANYQKLKDKLDKQEKEVGEVKSYKAEAEKVPALEAENIELERELKTAYLYRKGKKKIEWELNASQQALTQLKKDCEAYAQKVKEDLLQLEKKTTEVIEAPRFLIDVNERENLKSEAKRLQEVVADKEVQRHQQVYERINKILAFGEVMDAARVQLNKNYDSSKVKASANNLSNADITGFSSGVVRERDNLLTLLNGYCKEYARVKGFFGQINEVGDVEITESFLPRYLEGSNSVNKAYGFLRGELEKRKANPKAVTQPFTMNTGCD